MGKNQTVRALNGIRRMLERQNELSFDFAIALKKAIQAVNRQPNFSLLGRRGGNITKGLHSKDYYRRIGRLGGRPRIKHSDASR